jgi:uncharacterized repeat protein (TIGR01451 family)
VAIGDTTTYTVKVTNQGTADDANVQVVVTLAPELVPVSSAEGTIEGQTVTLPAIPKLAPKAVATNKIVARGVMAGDGHTKFTLSSDVLNRPLTHWCPGFGVWLVIPIPMGCRSRRIQIVAALYQTNMPVTEQDIVTLCVGRSGFNHTCQGPRIHLELPSRPLFPNFRPGIRNRIHLAWCHYCGILPAVL